MKKLVIFLSFIFCVSVFAFDANQPKSILLTPQPPKFSDVERQTELASRRAKVAEKLGKNSMLMLFSTEPRIYTNDVDYLYRQENNLFYLTNLAQKDATLVLYNDGTKTGEILFLPKRNPRQETWTGKMYSNDEASKILGLKTIVDATELKGFIEALKGKTAFTSKNEVSIPTTAENLYLILPESDRDSDGKREFGKEADFAKSISGFKVKNAQPIFADLRQIK